MSCGTIKACSAKAQSQGSLPWPPGAGSPGSWAALRTLSMLEVRCGAGLATAAP